MTLCGLAGIFVALFGARMACDAFSPKVSELLVPHFTTAIEERLGSGLEESLNEILAAGEQGGNAITDLLMKLGFYDEVAEAIRAAFTGQAAQSVTGAALSLAHSVSDVIADILVFVAAFLAITVLWFLLSRVLDLAARLPVIKGLNRTLGGLLGLLQGALLLFCAAWVLRLFGGVIPREIVEQTTLLNFFFNANPLSLITGI